MAGYTKGILENSAKMVLFFHIIEESIKSGDKVLVFRYTHLLTHMYTTYIGDPLFNLSVCLSYSLKHANSV